MPFRSARQRRYLFKHHPAIARRWAKRYGTKPKRRRVKQAAR